MRRIALLLGLSVLAGCASMRPSVPGSAADPTRLTAWQASGRIGIAAPGAGGSGTFDWQQRSSASEVTVRGPLGIGALRIRADGDTLRVDDGDGHTLDADSARGLLMERLGIDLPLQELRFWMLGLAAPGQPADISEASEPPLRTIAQSGWQVRYDQFTALAGWRVPARMTASRGEVRIKLILDDWRLPSAVAPDGEGRR